MVGKGAYGTVCSAKRMGDDVAIKKIETPLEEANLAFFKRKLRELRILRQLRHENIVSVLSIFVSGTDRFSNDSFQDLYVVSELMETDMTSILKSNQHLSDDHFQFFLYQILRGLKYIHSAKVIHRDIKPRNLLVNANCDLRICDFGLARLDFGDRVLNPQPQAVSTRWYRAPEVLCAWTNFSYNVDMWSVGTVFAEMLGKASQSALELLGMLVVFDPDDRCSIDEA